MKASCVSNRSLKTGKTRPLAFSTTHGPHFRFEVVSSTEKIPFVMTPCFASDGCKRITTVEEHVSERQVGSEGYEEVTNQAHGGLTRQEVTTPYVVFSFVLLADSLKISGFE